MSQFDGGLKALLKHNQNVSSLRDMLLREALLSLRERLRDKLGGDACAASLGDMLLRKAFLSLRERLRAELGGDVHPRYFQIFQEYCRLALVWGAYAFATEVRSYFVVYAPFVLRRGQVYKG